MNSISGSMQHVTWNAKTELVADTPRFDTLNLSPKAAADSEGRRENLWSGKDVLRFLCFEMGQEQKRGNLKSKTIDPLFSLQSDSKLGNTEHKSAAVLQGSRFNTQVSIRRQRKGCRPSRLPPTIDHTDEDEKKPGSLDPCSPLSPSVCRNSICKARTPSEVSFCQLWSCYICKRSDDLRDPSLWISCTSESAESGTFGCGVSCHVECALKTGVVGAGRNITLDGSYCCQICGRISSLIGYCKKQLMIAKDSGRVDVLCSRLVLSHRLLNGTLLHKNIHETIDAAIKRLEAEVGPMVKVSAKFASGIVKRLSCNPEVHKLVTSAIEKMDVLIENAKARAEDCKPQEAHILATCVMHFEDVSSSSIVVAVDDDISDSKQKPVGYYLWHRRASETSYPTNPTCVISSISKKALVSNLQALTQYAFKAVTFSSEGYERQCEAECSTKDIEVIQRPMAMSSSSDLVLSTANKTQDRNSNCLDQPIEMNHNSDECVARCSIHDFGNVLLDQQLLFVNEALSQGLPSPSIVEKKRRNHVEKALHCSPPASVKRNTRTDVSRLYWGGVKSKDVASSRPSAVHENNDPWSRDSKHDVHMGIAVPDMSGKLRVRQDFCMGVGNHVGEPRVESPLCGSETGERKETVTILSTVGRLNGYGEICTNTGNALVSDVLKSDYPHQSWAVQVRSKETGIGMKSKSGLVAKTTVQRVDSIQDHLNGVRSQKVDNGENRLELFVKVICWLECSGHLNKNLRIKFLTWYSLRATEHEKGVVSVFIDTLQDDPASLAGQLVDAFEDVIGTKRQQITVDDYSNRLAAKRNG